MGTCESPAQQIKEKPRNVNASNFRLGTKRERKVMIIYKTRGSSRDGKNMLQLNVKKKLKKIQIVFHHSFGFSRVRRRLFGLSDWV